VAEFDRRGITPDERMNRRSPGSRFGGLGDRVARTFFRYEPTESSQDVNGHVDHWVDGERALPRNEPLPRFPITRQGYDCAAVDAHVAELEQELVELDQELNELRARTPSRGEVAAEIERIGEQTSAILIAAHEQAQETTRLAQAQADRCIADAASNASAITSEANRQLRELESEKASLGFERERLLEDIRTLAAALSSLADDAAERFPPKPQNATPPPAIASKPADEPAIDGQARRDTPPAPDTTPRPADFPTGRHR
jgi:cell division septum initiation protein DivIVA